MILPRRQFLTGLAALIAAPAIVRASNIMPVRSLPPLVHPYKPWRGTWDNRIAVVAGSLLAMHGGDCYDVIGTGMVWVDKLDESPLLQRIGRTVGIPAELV